MLSFLSSHLLSMFLRLRSVSHPFPLVAASLRSVLRWYYKGGNDLLAQQEEGWQQAISSYHSGRTPLTQEEKSEVVGKTTRFNL